MTHGDRLYHRIHPTQYHQQLGKAPRVHFIRGRTPCASHPGSWLYVPSASCLRSTMQHERHEERAFSWDDVRSRWGQLLGGVSTIVLDIKGGVVEYHGLAGTPGKCKAGEAVEIRQPSLGSKAVVSVSSVPSSSGVRCRVLPPSGSSKRWLSILIPWRIHASRLPCRSLVSHPSESPVTALAPFDEAKVGLGKRHVYPTLIESLRQQSAYVGAILPQDRASRTTSSINRHDKLEVPSPCSPVAN